jgi:hypothetical protein
LLPAMPAIGRCSGDERRDDPGSHCLPY